MIEDTDMLAVDLLKWKEAYLDVNPFGYGEQFLQEQSESIANFISFIRGVYE